MKLGAPAEIRRLRPGDGALLGILASDFFGALAAATVHLTMVLWVLAQGASSTVVSLMVLTIFIPLNLGVLISGVAVARYGARRLLIASKAMALLGAFACFVLLAGDAMTLPVLSILAALTYGAMGPSITADIGRAPAFVRLAGRRLVDFHAVNGIAMVIGQVGGLGLAGLLADRFGAAAAVAAGCGLVVISLSITWASFPRDRPRAAGASAEIIAMTRDVFNRIDGRRIGRASVLAAAAVIAVAEGCSEVVLPVATRAADLPSIALSLALCAAVVASIAAALAAQAAHEKVALPVALSIAALSAALALFCAAVWGDWIAIAIAAAVSVAAASGVGTMTVTSLQEAMPASLQAQAIGLWQSLVLTVSAAAILAAGLAGWAALGLLAILAIAAALLVARAALPR